MIVENFKYVLDNYLQAYEETYKGHPLADFMRHDLTEPFKEIVDEDKYKISAAVGIGRWPIIPSLCFFNKDITTSAERGYYIDYLFKEDMTGVCLTLNFGAKELRKKYGKDKFVIAAEIFRNILQEEFEETLDYTPLDLGCKGDKKRAATIEYENGDVFNIEYKLDDLGDSITDEKIINDLNLFLRMYNYLHEKRGNTIFTDEELSRYNITPTIISPTEEDEEQTTMKFQKYLEDRNFFFDAKTIENYLLSLKVKPFIILTGNSGTGKTKLSQLFAEYLQTHEYNFDEDSEIENPEEETTNENPTEKISEEEHTVETEDENSEYHLVNVTTKLMSWGQSKDGTTTTPGWTLSSNDFRSVLPINQIEGEYEIEIDGYKTTANLYFLPALFYKRDAEEFKSYFKELYDQEQEQIRTDEENGVKHTTQKVKLGINYDAIKNAIADTYEQSDVITLEINLNNTLLEGRRIELTKDFKVYSPFEAVVPCKITSGGYFTEGNLELRFRLGNYKTDELLEHLNSQKENGIETVELKIFGFKPEIDDFTPIPESVEINDESKTDSDEIYAIVPVGSNWTENRNVVGYYNVLTKNYQHTQSLDLLLKAKYDSRPFFLILDEMNLSHVERYFSDFLSAMESGKKIPLHKAGKKYTGNVPEELKIPDNVFIIGTVNVDETTYMFSPKVLDRANVLEFKTFDKLSISDYIKNDHPEVKFSGNVDYLVNVRSDPDLRKDILKIINDEFKDVTFKLEYKRIENEGEETEEEIIEIEEGNVLDEIIDTLTQINEYLKGSGFEFGYRTVNEILAFMYVAWKYEDPEEEWTTWKRYLDAQILQKILPKLHGSQMVLGETLDNLLTYCLGLESIDDAPDLKDITDSYPYPDSAKKLMQMKEVLEKQRYVSFIN